MLRIKSKFVLFTIISISFLLLLKKKEYSIFYLMLVIFGILSFFSIVYRILLFKKVPIAEELKNRTITWWWMVAVFLLAVSTHRIISFCFMGFLCFLALREYFSLIPEKELTLEKKRSLKDKLAVLVCYLSIILTVYLAYIQWYGLYIILVPVYTFLLIPIIFVLQNKTEGILKSLGLISVGLMFFVFNLGHSLFMVNMGAMTLLYCFFLTETRDLLSYWVGKFLARLETKYFNNKLLKYLNVKIAYNINPRKTWGTGIIVAIFTTIISLAFVPILPDFPKGRISYNFAALLGFLIGILGLFGDLVFSMIKRDIGVKDSGNLLPGHGGIIDRVNSLVFTIPITFHLINWVYI